MKVETKSGSTYRFMKVHKLPWPDDAHHGFFPEAQYVDFFEHDEVDGIPDELERNVSTTLRHPRAAFSEPRLASGDS